jgi:ADP-heptose:LPS heptosyltransferase
VIQNLDLVITSDTALVHLAGALAAPTWLALPFSPDWRWLLEREDNPWYPTLRLFRQQRVGQWSDVFERIAGALAQQLAKRER